MCWGSWGDQCTGQASSSFIRKRDGEEFSTQIVSAENELRRSRFEKL